MSLGFFALTPERVLAAVEAAGTPTTGLCLALGSLENRVYEVELDDRVRVVAKFYRPGRWSEATILDEHRLLAHLAELEIPVCAPLGFPGGGTLRQTPEGIRFALFPRVGGRSPDEPTIADYEELGRLIGRIHNASASLGLRHRPELGPATYGRDCLRLILERATMAEGLRARYAAAVERLIAIGEARWPGVETFVVHADCHRGNLLRGSTGWFFLDFDDAAVAPPVQDLWLLLPGRPAHCRPELEAMVRGYETFRPFDAATVRLVEVLRGLRYVRYAAWIAARWDDPAFPRAFPHWGSDGYWAEQLGDVHEQVRLLEEEDGAPAW